MGTHCGKELKACSLIQCRPALKLGDGYAGTASDARRSTRSEGSRYALMLEGLPRPNGPVEARDRLCREVSTDSK